MTVPPEVAREWLAKLRAHILARYGFMCAGAWFGWPPSSVQSIPPPLYIQRNPAKRTGLSMLGARWMGFHAQVGL